MRKITIDFTKENPCENTVLGYVGEHNATELLIIPPKELAENERVKFFKLAFSVPYSVIYSENLYIGLLKNSIIEWSIPDSVTKHTVVSLQVEAYGEKGNLLMKSPTIHGLRFRESVNSDNDFNAVKSPIKCGVEVTATDSDGNITELIVYGDLSAGLDIRSNKLEKVTLRGMTEIPQSFFEGCSALREVESDGIITAIGNKSFKNCNALKKISFGEGLRHIGKDAFNGCTSLESIPLTDSAEKIEDYAFYNCTALKSISLSENIISVGNYAFSGTGLSEIIIPSASCVWGDFCFARSSLENVTLHEEMTYLPSFFFYKCEKLKNIALPDSLTSIGQDAFGNCTSLERIELPKGLTSTGEETFEECTSLAEVSLGNVTTIGKEAFNGCKSLKKIALPEGLTTIEKYAFKRSGLSEISVPESVATLGDGVFYYCTSLEKIELPLENMTSLPYQFLTNTAITDFEIPEHFTEIEGYAFSGCTRLKNVTVGSGVTAIGYGAFMSCYALEYVRMKRTSPPNISSYASFPSGSSNFVGIYVPKSENGAVLNAYKTATNWKYFGERIFEWEGEE